MFEFWGKCLRKDKHAGQRFTTGSRKPLYRQVMRAVLSFSSRLGVARAGTRHLAGLARMMKRMTLPLQPGRPGRSEFGFGKGHFPHPESDYQSHRSELAVPVGEDQMVQIRQFIADRRTDPTDATSGGYDDMLFEKGNPDTFGPQPKLVQEAARVPSGQSPQPAFRTGVTREE